MVSTISDATHTLGPHLRTLRKDAGMTGKQLAAVLSWSPSKISKIENAQQTPTEADICDWAMATHAEQKIDDLLAFLRTVTVQHAEWQTLLRPGLTAHQRELGDLDTRTRTFRIFESAVIPGILQTPDYARARFAEAVALLAVPSDVDGAVQIRLRRQEILYNPDKQVHIVLTEAALRNLVCPVEVMQAQLDRLVVLTTLSNVSFGIVPSEAYLPVAPLHGFGLFDQDRVIVETVCAELTLAQPAEVELYSHVFDQLAATAIYGPSARSLLIHAIEELTAETTENV